jgi:ABC-type Fe3+/spermidine/putrescine transport system ATPase subunit
MTDFLILDRLTKRFDGFAAVDDLSLGLGQGEILALLGPSGSGKTTTLRLLAGFEWADNGRVVVDGQDVTRVAPVARRFGMVFQHYALFPHLDVGANVSFGLEGGRLDREERKRRVAEALTLVDLAGYERREVSELSGGQQQRVALARALAPEPRILLLDEPLSNLDPSLRERTRSELRDLIHRVGITTVLVTHEQEEAFDLGDRIALLRDGRLQQVGSPDELYQAPTNPFVAGFVGRSSKITGEVTRGDPTVLVSGGVRWPLPSGADGFTGPGIMMARPEAFMLVEQGSGITDVTVGLRRFLGATALFKVVTDHETVLEVVADPNAVSAGDRVGLELTGNGVHVFPADDA